MKKKQDVDAVLTEAMVVAVQRYQDSKPNWFLPLATHHPSLTFHLFNQILLGKKDWKVEKGKLIIY